jgi:hypothetical protein
MLISKIIYGCVVQVFDTEQMKYVSQKFEPSEDIIEDFDCEENTIPVEAIDYTIENPFPTNMVQP